MDQELDRPVTAVPLVVRIRRRIDAMMAQGQELLHTFRRLFESTISSRMTLIFVVEGMRRRTDVGTAGRLLGKFRRHPHAVGQRRPARTTDRAICDDRHHTNLVRTAPLLRADMILGKDRCG